MLNRLFKRRYGGSNVHSTYENSKKTAGLDKRPKFEFEDYPLIYPKREIRLLKLLPGVYGSEIECEIHNTAFPSPDEYSALSYEWGAPEDVKTILVNGQALRIRKNLWRFLQRLRSHDFDKKEGDLKLEYLWCDAICIDQDPKSLEKNYQIGLMAQIYARAQTVCAWLGEHDFETETMCQRLEFYAQQHGMPTGANQIERDALQQCLGSSLVAIEKLLKRSYWRRLWIVQEVLIPKLMVVFCGSHYFDPAGVDLLWILARMHRDSLGIGADQSDDNLGPGYSLLSERGFSHDGESQAMPLRDLICANYQRGCSDPHDYVYALLGMARESKAGQIFPVNYETTLETLLEELILFYPDKIPLDAVKALIYAFRGRGHAEDLSHLESALCQLCNAPRLSAHRYNTSVDNLGTVSRSYKLDSYDYQRPTDLVWRHLCGSEAKSLDSIFRLRDRSLCLICRHEWGALLSLVGLGSVETGYKNSARSEAYSKAIDRGTFQLAKAIISSTVNPATMISLNNTSEHFKLTCNDAIVIESAECLGSGFAMDTGVSEMRFLKSGIWNMIEIRSPSLSDTAARLIPPARRKQPAPMNILYHDDLPWR